MIIALAYLYTYGTLWQRYRKILPACIIQVIIIIILNYSDYYYSCIVKIRLNHVTSKQNMLSSTKQDETKHLLRILGRYASLSTELLLPEVFSPPPVAEPSSYQCLNTITAVIANENTERVSDNFHKKSPISPS